MATLLCPRVWRSGLLSKLVKHRKPHAVQGLHLQCKLGVTGTKMYGSCTNISRQSLPRNIRSKTSLSVKHDFRPTCSTHWLFKRTGGQLFQYTTPAKFQHLGVKTTVAAGFQRSPENTPDRHSPAFPSDSGLTLYLTAENGYLSWMRNSYIMTVVLVGTANLDIGSLEPPICLVIVLTAASNMLIGSVGFITNLNSIKKRGHISSARCLRIQATVLLHFVCWFSVLLLLTAVAVGHVEIADDPRQDGGSADE